MISLESELVWAEITTEDKDGGVDVTNCFCSPCPPSLQFLFLPKSSHIYHPLLTCQINSNLTSLFSFTCLSHSSTHTHPYFSNSALKSLGHSPNVPHSHSSLYFLFKPFVLSLCLIFFSWLCSPVFHKYPVACSLLSACPFFHSSACLSSCPPVNL